ncbi:unnamed protein product [Amoebophrya sp. A120]|nr:unnamed protein product [Amoebophrya sp. A120]|eukprot:GSA120T00006852001.1
MVSFFSAGTSTSSLNARRFAVAPSAPRLLLSAAAFLCMSLMSLSSNGAVFAVHLQLQSSVDVSEQGNIKREEIQRTRSRKSDSREIEIKSAVSGKTLLSVPVAGIPSCTVANEHTTLDASTAGSTTSGSSTSAGFTFERLLSKICSLVQPVETVRAITVQDLLKAAALLPEAEGSWAAALLPVKIVLGDRVFGAQECRNGTAKISVDEAVRHGVFIILDAEKLGELRGELRHLEDGLGILAADEETRAEKGRRDRYMKRAGRAVAHVLFSCGLGCAFAIVPTDHDVPRPIVLLMQGLYLVACAVVELGKSNELEMRVRVADLRSMLHGLPEVGPPRGEQDPAAG